MLYPRVDGTIVKPHHACEQLWVNAISKYKVTYQFSWPTSFFSYEYSRFSRFTKDADFLLDESDGANLRASLAFLLFHTNHIVDFFGCMDGSMLLQIPQNQPMTS